MTKPSPIGPVHGARDARAHRAAQRWASDHATDATPELLQLLQAKCASSAAALERDLLPGEVESVCAAALKQHEHDEGQRLAEEAVASAREEERLAYLRRKAAEYKLTNTSDETRPESRRGIVRQQLGDGRYSVQVDGAEVVAGIAPRLKANGIPVEPGDVVNVARQVDGSLTIVWRQHRNARPEEWRRT